MKVETDKSVTRVMYIRSGFTNGVAPIGMKYKVGEFDSELWAYEVYEVLFSMKS